MKYIKLLLSAVLFSTVLACGGPGEDFDNERSPDARLSELEQRLLALQDQLGLLAESDFKSCDPLLDDTVESICKIAQASSIEAQTKTRSELVSLVSQLESKLTDSQRDVASLATAWIKIYGVDFPETSGAPTPSEADCLGFGASASLIECVKVMQSAIDALQVTVAALSSSITGYMSVVEIGSENISAGPVYEQILRMSGGNGRINAFVDGKSPPYVLGSNPLNATNGSSSVTATTSAGHGLSPGNRVVFSNCTSGRGFTSQQLSAEFSVLTTPSATTFTVAMSSNATSGGTLGGTTCLIQAFTGYGMKTIWTNTSSSDTEIRYTSGGSKSYAFAICKTTGGLGRVCYDSANRVALFAAISAIPGWGTTCASSGSVQCK
jgi:hypothetical protein